MNFKKEIEEIKKRNARVEADKAWETSWARRILVALLTHSGSVILFSGTTSKPIYKFTCTNDWVLGFNTHN